MTIAILEAVSGTLAAGIVIWACWNEKQLIAVNHNKPLEEKTLILLPL